MRPHPSHALLTPLFLLTLFTPFALRAETPAGYYRFPAINGDTVVFTAEGDLWSVPVTGGAARRLTSHPGEEFNAAISPDGATVAFSAQYEGPTEVYTMPLAGGLPERRTFEGETAMVQGWTPSGKVIYSTKHFATLPVTQLALVDPATGVIDRVPLNQASDGAYDPSGVLFFTRLPFQGSHCKNYKGGTAQNLWRFADGDAEATPLTADYTGTSKRAMVWEGRIYFISDRDGTMNLWSMTPTGGGDLRQHTHHDGWDIKGAALSAGRIVYQLGADLRLYDIAKDADAPIPITLTSDFDQMREKWVKNPIEWLSSAHIAPDGSAVALTARGQVFTAPAGQGRLARITRSEAARARDARYMPDGKSLLAISDESGEPEFWTLPTDGLGKSEQLTTDGAVHRFGGLPAPDGARVAFTDKNQDLWVLDVNKKENRRIATNGIDVPSDLAWSSDSRWLAFVAPAENGFRQIVIWNADNGTTTAVTTDRSNSQSPAWSTDGQWLYFASDRKLTNTVRSPWGNRQPDPYFDRTMRLYALALTSDVKNPFAPETELTKDEEKPKPTPTPAKTDENEANKDEAAEADKPAENSDEPKTEEPTKADNPDSDKMPAHKIDLDGIQQRIYELPIPPGNYDDLLAGDKRIYYTDRDSNLDAKKRLLFAPVARKDVNPKVIAYDVESYELSQDGKKLLIRRPDAVFIIPASADSPGALDAGRVNLSGWAFSFAPRDEWRQMFVEAWRLERDYFYDRHMHGLDWKAVLKKYLPLADRISDRAELSDALAQMISELSALHMSVRGGEMRKGPDEISPASLGAVYERAENVSGWRITRIYKTDPDYPEELAPLARPESRAKEGDILLQINGVPTLSVAHPSLLLRGQAGRQVRLRLRTPGEDPRDIVAIPIGDESGLRYSDWEQSRRTMTEELGGGDIAYVHLRKMGTDDFTTWARQVYPVFNRKGLVIDVRNNTGGNIDSWILGKLLRRDWFYWAPRVGTPYWNMQQAFRGQAVVICNEHTASDGEAFSEGFRRLGLGKVVGTRTWGGEIWLSYDNTLVDRGIASACENGVYGPEGQWLIEGHGVDPDIVVDNLPHATYLGEDAQLKAAIAHLQEAIRTNPDPIPTPPPYPNKSRPAPAK